MMKAVGRGGGDSVPGESPIDIKWVTVYMGCDLSRDFTRSKDEQNIWSIYHLDDECGIELYSVNKMKYAGAR